MPGPIDSASGTTEVVRDGAVSMTEFSPEPVSPPAMLADEVATPLAEVRAGLDRVGMRGIEMPVRLRVEDESVLVPGALAVAVDLHDPLARGIHMSRLYRLCAEHLGASVPEPAGLRRLLAALLESHAGLSRQVVLELGFTLPVRRPALRSGLSGWRQYPIRIRCELGSTFWRCELGCEVLYSSTCPGSAAMARQLVAQRFRETFGTGPVDAGAVARWLESSDGGAATPHAQRSRARVEVALANGQTSLPMLDLIDRVEAVLATPVQGAVRRIDEQEFARLNGENPLYCEDAARRIRTALESIDWISDYRIEAAHLESLHPHDAVARVVKGVTGGFQA